MQRYKKKCLCLILILCALFAGVCFENTKTDVFLSSPNQSLITAATVFEQEKFQDTEPCATVKSITRSNMSIQKIIHSNAKKLEIRQNCGSLSSHRFAFTGSGAEGNFEDISIKNLYSKKILTRYIHQSDGKKRI